MAKRYVGEDANYDFEAQVAPPKNMGSGSFANLPDKPMYLSYGKAHCYRDGITNDFDTNVYDVSEIPENRKIPKR